MHDVLGLAARPEHVLLTGSQWRPDGVQTRHEVAVVAKGVEDRLADPGHDAHRGGYVAGVSDLHSEDRMFAVDRAHAEGDDVHGSPTHAAAVELGHLGFHL